MCSARGHFLFTSHVGKPLCVWDRRSMSAPLHESEQLGCFRWINPTVGILNIKRYFSSFKWHAFDCVTLILWNDTLTAEGPRHNCKWLDACFDAWNSQIKVLGFPLPCSREYPTRLLLGPPARAAAHSAMYLEVDAGGDVLVGRAENGKGQDDRLPQSDDHRPAERNFLRCHHHLHALSKSSRCCVGQA